MPYVLDASMTMSWCFADESSPSTQGVLRQIKETYVEVPAVWPLEIANVLVMGERRRRLTRVMADEFLQQVSRLDIRVQGATALAFTIGASTKIWSLGVRCRLSRIIPAQESRNRDLG